jgi:hypothetical protein
MLGADDLLKLKSAGGYTETLKPSSSDYSYSNYGNRLTVALCYGNGASMPTGTDAIKGEQKKYIMITNPFTSESN